jgi:hypothetical protein
MASQKMQGETQGLSTYLALITERPTSQNEEEEGKHVALAEEEIRMQSRCPHQVRSQ